MCPLISGYKNNHWFSLSTWVLPDYHGQMVRLLHWSWIQITPVFPLSVDFSSSLISPVSIYYALAVCLTRSGFQLFTLLTGDLGRVTWHLGGLISPLKKQNTTCLAWLAEYWEAQRCILHQESAVEIWSSRPLLNNSIHLCSYRALTRYYNGLGSRHLKMNKTYSL